MLVNESVPPVPLRFTAVPVVVVTLASPTVTPVTLPPLKPGKVEVERSRPRTLLLVASVVSAK
jgi:hypothetical protein